VLAQRRDASGRERHERTPTDAILPVAECSKFTWSDLAPWRVFLPGMPRMDAALNRTLSD
jgi:hypothetical protein